MKNPFFMLPWKDKKSITSHYRQTVPESFLVYHLVNLQWLTHFPIGQFFHRFSEIVILVIWLNEVVILDNVGQLKRVLRQTIEVWPKTTIQWNKYLILGRRSMSL